MAALRHFRTQWKNKSTPSTERAFQIGQFKYLKAKCIGRQIGNTKSNFGNPPPTPFSYRTATRIAIGFSRPWFGECLCCHVVPSRTFGIYAFFFHDSTALSGTERPYCRGCTITLRHTAFSRTALEDWSALAETSTRQHTTLTTDRHPCSRRDSNPQSQQTNCRRPTP